MSLVEPLAFCLGVVLFILGVTLQIHGQAVKDNANLTGLLRDLNHMFELREAGATAGLYEHTISPLLERVGETLKSKDAAKKGKNPT